MTFRFQGEAMFGGVARVMPGPVGQFIVRAGTLDPLSPKALAVGTVNVAVRVRGRLIAPTRSKLVAVIGGVEGRITDPPVRGRLEDGSGRVWEDVAFVRFEMLAPIDVGHSASVAFVATFMRVDSVASGGDGGLPPDDA